MYLVLMLTGLGSSAVYAAIALSIVITYKGTGVINFAAGSMGMWTAYVFHSLVVSGQLVLPIILIPSRISLGHVSFVLAMTLALLEAVLIGLMAHFLVFRPLQNKPSLAKVVASVGLMLTLQALVILRFGTNQLAPVPILPHSDVRILGQSVDVQNLWLSLITVAVTLVLWAYFRFTRLGTATRGAAENERYVVLSGISPNLLAGVTWIGASLVAGLLLTLGSPIVQLNPNLFVQATVPALAAALTARFSSLAMATLAGLALGSLTSILGYTTSQSYWPTWAQSGSTSVFPFLVIVLVLFVFGRAIPSRGEGPSDPLPSVPSPRMGPRAVIPVVALGLVLMFGTSGGYRFGLINSLIITIVALSLVVVTGLVGQISLAQAGLAGAGGFVLSGLSNSLAIPFPISTLLAGLVAAAFGVLIGLPALRIRGAQLAVVTLAAALALDQFVFGNPSFTQSGGVMIPDPSLFGINLAVQKGYNTARWQFGLVVVLVVVLCAFGVGNLIRSDTGRAFLAIRSNERASAAAGISVTSNKLVAFAIASFFAGICGAFLGYSRGQISADSFSSANGVTFLVFAYLGGITSIFGSIVAGALAPLGFGYVLITRLFPGLGNEYILISSVALILTAILNPDGISSAMAGRATAMASRFRRLTLGQSDESADVGLSDHQEGTTGRQLTQTSAKIDEITPTSAPGAALSSKLAGAALERRPVDPSRPTRGLTHPEGLAREPVLQVVRLSIKYGGLLAVDNVSLDVKAGEVVGLIGPNGAGKTSIVDAVSGFTPAAGEVRVRGVDFGRLAPHQRARAGLGRTWQAVELFGDLTVRENISVATARSSALKSVLDLVRPRSRVSKDALWAASLLKLEDSLDKKPGQLSLGRQKLVGVARALAPRPAVVILDEPAAGLDSNETLGLLRDIRAVAAENIAILLIDHDMDLVLEACNRIVVLNFGKMIAVGSPEAIRGDPAVVAAYLGESCDYQAATATADIGVSK